LPARHYFTQDSSPIVQRLHGLPWARYVRRLDGAALKRVGASVAARCRCGRRPTGGYGYNLAYDPVASPRGDTFEGRDSRYS